MVCQAGVPCVMGSTKGWWTREDDAMSPVNGLPPGHDDGNALSWN